MKAWLAVAVLLGLPGTSAVADESPAEPHPIRYQLDDEAMMEAGCLAPCMCPVLVRSPLSGTMTLMPSGFDGAYQHYEVRDVAWKFSQGPVSVAVSGSGTYRVSGDSQQLALDLVVNGEAPRRYDSGLTGGGLVFPRLHLPVALHGFFCFDSVYGVEATPSVAGVAPPSAPIPDLRLGPNPFRAATGIAFDLASPEPVGLTIHDLAGRTVRTLLRGAALEAGPHRIDWNGRDESGHDAPAGIYFVRLKAPGREAQATLVKL